MKTFLLVALVGLCGCSTVSGLKESPGGTIGAVQALDDAAAAKYGVPPEVTARVRKALGIIDTRALPDASRVLPAGWTWKQDILDGDGKPVDVSKFHKGPPYIVPDGTAPQNSVTTADLFPDMAAVSAEEAILKLIGAIKADPSLLEPAE